MSKDEKRTQRGPGGFEDKIDAAMADLEVDLDDEFHGADFFDEEDTQSSEDGDFDSWDDTDEADDRRTPQKRITRKNIRRKRNTIRSIQMNLRRSLKRTMTRRSLKSLMRKMIPMMMNQMSHRSVSFR